MEIGYIKLSMNSWKTKSSKIVYENGRFSIREDQIVKPDGTDGVFYVMDRAPVIIIIPVSKNNEIYLIRVNRYTTRKTRWELPAGSSDKQDELIAAKRELKEETGLISKKWIKIGKLEVAPGMTGQLAHVFVARDVELTSENEQNEENIDKMQRFSFEKVLQMIKNGEIVNGPSISAIMCAELKLWSNFFPVDSSGRELGGE